MPAVRTPCAVGWSVFHFGFKQRTAYPGGRLSSMREELCGAHSLEPGRLDLTAGGRTFVQLAESVIFSFWTLDHTFS